MQQFIVIMGDSQKIGCSHQTLEDRPFYFYFILFKIWFCLVMELEAQLARLSSNSKNPPGSNLKSETSGWEKGVSETCIIFSSPLL